MKPIINGLTKVLEIICIILFALLVITTTWQVFSRLVLNSPVTWSEELAKMLFVWLSFLGSALVYGTRGHMAVEFLARKFGEGTERKLAVFTHVIGMIFALLVLAWGGFNAAMNAWSQNLTALPVNIGSVYLVIPLAGIAIALYAAYYIIEISAGRVTPYPVPEAEVEEENAKKIAAEAKAEMKDAPLDDERTIEAIQEEQARHSDGSAGSSRKDIMK